MTKTPLAYTAAATLAMLAGCAQQPQPAAKAPTTAVSLAGRSYSVALPAETAQNRAARSMQVTTAPALPTAATSTGAPETAELK